MSARTPLPPYDAPVQAMRAAGAWLARRDRGFTAAEQGEFDSWLRADPGHAAAVAQLERALATFDGLRELVPHGGSEPDPDVFAPPPRPRRPFFRSAAVAGLAAAVALAVVFWQAQSPTAPTTWHYATASAGYERATLIDGSTIELNADTVLDVEFTAAGRQVRLRRGEAHFQVAKNPARPFVVQAGAVAVRAVGTAFNMRLAPAAVEVLVIEGKVRVDHPPAQGAAGLPVPGTGGRTEIPLLGAGQKIVVSTAATAAPPIVAAVSTEEMARALAWQPGISEFTKKPLAEIVAEFNRRNRQQLVIGDPALAALRIGGNFRADQPDAFVRLLESSFGVTAVRSGDAITLRTAP